MYDNYILTVETSVPLDQSDIFTGINFSVVERDLDCILVTPICDLVGLNKTDYIHFCAVLPFDDLFFKYLEKELNITEDQFQSAELSATKKGRAIQFIDQVVGGMRPPFQWLGKLPNRQGFWFVDYQLTACHPITIKGNPEFILKRIAKVNSPLRELIFVRYSYYMARVGLPGSDDERKIYSKGVYQLIRQL
jgi:hypothetical protein